MMWPELTEDAVMGGWMLDAACRDEDPALWFPDSEIPAAYLPARRICNACPVREECLRRALRAETASTRQGMWGGLTPKERARLVTDGTR